MGRVNKHRSTVTETENREGRSPKPTAAPLSRSRQRNCRPVNSPRTPIALYPAESIGSLASRARYPRRGCPGAAVNILTECRSTATTRTIAGKILS